MTEAPAILCLRSVNGLQGASAFDAEALERFPFGSEIEIRARQARSDARRRFYFAVLSEVVPNIPDHWCIPDRDALHEWVKVRLGYTTEYVLPAKTAVWIKGVDGEPELVTIHDEVSAYRAKSIAIKSMDEAMFSEMLGRVLDLIGTVLIPGMDVRLLYKEAKKSLGRTYQKATA